MTDRMSAEDQGKVSKAQLQAVARWREHPYRDKADALAVLIRLGMGTLGYSADDIPEEYLAWIRGHAESVLAPPEPDSLFHCECGADATWYLSAPESRRAFAACDEHPLAMLRDVAVVDRQPVLLRRIGTNRVRA